MITLAFVFVVALPLAAGWWRAVIRSRRIDYLCAVRVEDANRIRDLRRDEYRCAARKLALLRAMIANDQDFDGDRALAIIDMPNPFNVRLHKEP